MILKGLEIVGASKVVIDRHLIELSGMVAVLFNLGSSRLILAACVYPFFTISSQALSTSGSDWAIRWWIEPVSTEEGARCCTARRRLIFSCALLCFVGVRAVKLD